MSTSRIPASLLKAYRQTDYRVQAPRPFVMHIGQASQALCLLHRQYGVASSAFITACNPYSRLLTDQENAERQQRLAEAIAHGGWRSIPGSGKHISGPWPAEACFLVLGIDREAARRLGRAFEQNAIVFCEADFVPELMLLR
ncbi:DUF3293 domain-containing protein [Pusillimonas sp.]|uniref:DUF3293 domain-containing protein n=1 Tax=Pusillimonas sp. TaxID=3040095 RepID=UPI0029BA33E0|nr:DUF3293 domain-containing protein [Pusillimonas sp.]MDX3894255.1 DUF3293 domain-containing protein [Pusillimonas sp.]